MSSPWVGMILSIDQETVIVDERQKILLNFRTKQIKVIPVKMTYLYSR